MNKIKVVGIICIILLIMIIPTNARPEYVAAIQSIYGTNLCAECHTDQNGGKSLTDFGIKFKAQPNYEADPAATYNIVKGNESVTAVPTTVKENEPEKSLQDLIYY